MKLSQEQIDEINEMLSDKLGPDLDDVVPEARLKEDFGADSLDNVEVIMELERIFNCVINDDLAEEIYTVQDIYDTLESIL